MRPLRLTVGIEQVNNSVDLSHPAWMLSVENIRATQNLREFLIQSDESPIRDFLTDQSLFDFSDLSTAGFIHPSDLVAVSRACVNEWFGVLYGHPWWEILAHGVDESLFHDWVRQNYGLSKIAAKSSAIAAANSVHNRHFFIESIIEEFDHHSSFFRASAPRLSIGEGFYDGQTTLGIRALEKHLCKLAQTDELALILFYYFQECSAYLVEDFRSYYAHLEQAYDIDGFFDGWLSHVDVDDDLDHGGDVENVLSGFTEVKPSQLISSLESAWLGVSLLLSDYDRMAGIDLDLSVRDFSQGETETIALYGLSTADQSSDINAFGKLLRDKDHGSETIASNCWEKSVYDLAARIIACGDFAGSCIQEPASFNSNEVKSF